MKQAAQDVYTKTSAKFLELYRQLNPQQRRAVDTIEGTVMVLAGPGTGKTQLLAMRIANILKQTQMDPWNILCLTFTESAVIAMRERLFFIISEAAYYVRIHTFHSFCNAIIQEHPELLAVGRLWQPVSDIEKVELLESLLDSLPSANPLKIFGRPYFYLKDISQRIQSLKQEHITPEEFQRRLATIARFIALAKEAANDFFFLSPAQRTDASCDDFYQQMLRVTRQAELNEGLVKIILSTYEVYRTALEAAAGARGAGKARTIYKNRMKRWYEKLGRDLDVQQALAEIFAEYQRQMTARGRYDFEDMINQAVETLAKREDLLAEYQEQFQYILVDEYQDTNGAQNEIVRLLGSFDDQPNICVVGDDKQSIYRFQGASLTNMLDFYRQYQNHVTVVSLQQNYRSQPMVLAAADAVISHNQEALTKYIPGTTAQLIPQAGRPAQALLLLRAPSQEVEDYSLAKNIASLVTAGVSPAEIAVIVRKHRDSLGVLHYLRQVRVPTRLEAGEDALASQVVQQFLKLLEFIADIRRDDLLATALNYSWLRLPPLDIARVLYWAGVRQRSLWSVMTDAAKLEAAGVQITATWQKLAQRIAQWQALQHNTSLYNFLATVNREAGLLDYLLTPDGQMALPSICRLLEEAKALNAVRRDLSLVGFLSAVRRLQRHELPLMTRPWQNSENAVRVMTAHKAKGLEFEHVFLLRMNDRHWGNNPAPVRLALPSGLVRHDFVAGENNEDERRLFYVAITRAKATLTLSYALHNEQGRATSPSLFIQELPAEVVFQGQISEDFSVGQKRLADSLRAAPTENGAEAAAWARSQLSRYVMSVTHLNNYLACPRLFYIRNILRVPTARTVYQALGTAIHGALKDFLESYKREMKRPTKKFLTQSLKRCVEQERLSSTEAQQVFEFGRKVLRLYYDRYALSFAATAIGEFDFGSQAVRVGEAAVTGKIDKIEFLDQARRTVNVVDYKTGQPDNKAAALKPGGNYHRQIVFYKLLCDASPRFRYTMVSGEIDFVQPSRKGEFVKKKIEVTPADVEELKKNIAQVWQDVQAVRFLDPAAWCGQCEYCVYSSIG